MDYFAALQERLNLALDGRDATSRAVAASLLTLALGIVVFSAAPALWPLLGLAVVVSARFAGGEGIAASTATAALVLALLTSKMGVNGGMCAVGLLAFVASAVFVSGSGLTASQTPAAARVDMPQPPDLLTGTAFRSTLGLECRRADRHGHPLALVILDIDHLAHVNARVGRAVGNAIIESVARALLAASRETDIAGYLGADRFAVIVTGAPHTGVDAAERIRAAAANFVDGTYSGPTTLSAGVATHVSRLRASDLILDAEDALSLAKAEGRDRVCEAARGSLLRAAA